MVCVCDQFHSKPKAHTNHKFPMLKTGMQGKIDWTHLIRLHSLLPLALLQFLLLLLLLFLSLLLHPLQQELGVDVGLLQQVLQAQEPLLLNHATQLLHLMKGERQ